MNHVFYDTETTGANVRHDQVLQFAAVLTDDAFNELDRINIRSRLAPHIVPSPVALLVTKLEPARLATGYAPFEFARAVHAKLRGDWAPATFVSFNGLRFDEEIMRQTFWQNLLEPYITNTGGSARLDLLRVIQVAHAADPSILATALTDKGNVSFRLEALAQLNGFAGHDAHDALGDVRATIHLAKLVRARAPEIWARMTANADARKVQALLLDHEVLRHATHYGEPRVHEITRIAAAPGNAKQIAAFDLAFDPAPYLNLEPEQIAEILASKENKPIRSIKANDMPALFTLNDDAAPRPADPLPAGLRDARAQQVRAAAGFADAVAKALDIRRAAFETSPHLEEQIYNGFPTRSDTRTMQKFHDAQDWAERMRLARTFEDARMKNLAARILYINAPETLTEEQRARFAKSVIEGRILAQGEVPWTTLAKARADLAECSDTPERAEIGRWLDAFEAETMARLAQANEVLARAAERAAQQAAAQSPTAAQPAPAAV